MADYTSKLKTWGATGTEYPDGYSYLEGEQPVDDWDNFIRYNVIEDTQSLIDLTNKRVESDSGTTHPSSPEPAHLSYRTDDERLYAYDATASSWHGLMKIDGDTLQGDLNLGGHVLSGVGKLELDGNIDLSGDNLLDSVAGNTLYDATAGHIPLDVLESNAVSLSAGSHLSGGGTISLGGELSVSVDDDFLLNDGDEITGELTGKQAEGSQYFTAENTTSGDRLSVKSETDGDFSFVGYDSSAGTWEYGSALEYSPGNGIWTFKSTPTVNGDNIATQPWVESYDYVHIDDMPSQTGSTAKSGDETGGNTNSTTNLNDGTYTTTKSVSVSDPSTDEFFFNYSTDSWGSGDTITLNECRLYVDGTLEYTTNPTGTDSVGWSDSYLVAAESYNSAKVEMDFSLDIGSVTNDLYVTLNYNILDVSPHAHSI